MNGSAVNAKSTWLNPMVATITSTRGPVVEEAAEDQLVRVLTVAAREMGEDEARTSTRT